MRTGPDHAQPRCGYQGTEHLGGECEVAREDAVVEGCCDDGCYKANEKERGSQKSGVVVRVSIRSLINTYRA